MDYEFLTCDVKDGVALITLNRPDKRNALSTALRREIVAVLNELAKDDQVRVAVLTGAGPTFCAGFDLKELAAGNMEEIFAEAEIYHHAVHSFPKPLIGAVNGPALAGGMDLALMCDFRIAAETAAFGQPQVRMGVPAAFNLIRLVLPEAVARELCVTGRVMAADEALKVGLVNKVVGGDTLMAEVMETARSAAEIGDLRMVKGLFLQEQPEIFKPGQ